MFLFRNAASNVEKKPSTSSGQKLGTVWVMVLISTATAAAGWRIRRCCCQCRCCCCRHQLGRPCLRSPGQNCLYRRLQLLLVDRHLLVLRQREAQPTHKTLKKSKTFLRRGHQCGSCLEIKDEATWSLAMTRVRSLFRHAVKVKV